MGVERRRNLTRGYGRVHRWSDRCWELRSARVYCGLSHRTIVECVYIEPLLS
jgi:hypothetical protein